MKLIKIKEDHYVVVDDSEIKEDHYVVVDDSEIKEDDWVVSGTKTIKKITHSTRPFGGSATAISLHEVKKLIGEVDVEKKAREEILYNDSKREWWKQGYNQALEDNKEKKYTEADMLKCWNACLDFNKPAGLDSGINFKNFIQSLQPKTEWEVELVDGKLKLI